MKSKGYGETSIVSYLTARSSRDLVVAANQVLTREWWETRRPDFDLFISEFVSQEAAAGDSNAAGCRLVVIESIPELTVTDEVGELARILLQSVPLPPKAQVDTLHIAVAAVNSMDYLLTWNCSHINNASLRPRVDSVCRSMGLEPPIICTPQELLEI